MLDSGSIQKIRCEIDKIDTLILDLLNKRAEKSFHIRELKTSSSVGLFDPKRESEVLNLLIDKNNGPLETQQIEEIYKTIFKVMKEGPLNER